MKLDILDCGFNFDSLSNFFLAKNNFKSSGFTTLVFTLVCCLGIFGFGLVSWVGFWSVSLTGFFFISGRVFFLISRSWFWFSGTSLVSIWFWLTFSGAHLVGDVVVVHLL